MAYDPELQAELVGDLQRIFDALDHLADVWTPRIVDWRANADDAQMAEIENMFVAADEHFRRLDALDFGV